MYGPGVPRQKASECDVENHFPKSPPFLGSGILMSYLYEMPGIELSTLVNIWLEPPHS